jgi:energy-coupling factor transporter transmembrane protein EcfT
MLGPFEDHSLKNQQDLVPKAFGLLILWALAMVCQSVVFSVVIALVLAAFNQRWTGSAKVFGWVLGSCLIYSLPGLAVVGIDLLQLLKGGSSDAVFHGRRLAAVSGVFVGTTSCMFTLLLNIPVTKIFATLGRLGVPALLLELFYLVLRQIQNLLMFSQAVAQAQRSRLGDSGFKARWLGLTLGVPKLFTEAMGLVETTHQALESRSWEGTFRSLEEGGEVFSFRSCSVEALLWGSAVGVLGMMGILCRMHSIL